MVEQVPTQQEKTYAIRARSGLANFKTVGTSAARALFLKAGLFSDTAIGVMGTGVYTIDPATTATTQLTGTLLGNALVDIDGGQDADLNSVCRAATGSALYKITEADGVVLEDFPSSGGAGATTICYHRGFWLAAEAGTDQVYYQVPGDANWDALSFASAEYAPDKIVAIRSRGDQIALLGAETTEIWTLTGQADPAIAPYGGLNFDFGCRSRDAAVNVAGTLIWVDQRCIVRAFGGGDVSVISDEGISEQIRSVSAADLSASWYQRDNHLFYVLQLGITATWVYDLSTKEWSTRSSNSFDFWRARLFATLGDSVLAADSQGPTIWGVDPSGYDDDGDNFSVAFSAFVEMPEKSLPCANIELICATGYVAEGVSPVIQMRFSDDGGKTWGSWRERTLGTTGQYSQRVRWNALGTITAPHGRIFQFRCSDAAGRRFSDLRMNVS